MRFLMMFGPMIYRAYSKWSAKRSTKSVDQQVVQNEQMPRDSEVNLKNKEKDIKYDGDEFV